MLVYQQYLIFHKHASHLVVIPDNLLGFTVLQDDWLCLEGFHWFLNLPVQLSTPCNTTSYRWQVAGDHRLLLVLLIQFADGLQIPAVVHQDFGVLFVDVQIRA